MKNIYNEYVRGITLQPEFVDKIKIPASVLINYTNLYGSISKFVRQTGYLDVNIYVTKVTDIDTSDPYSELNIGDIFSVRAEFVSENGFIGGIRSRDSVFINDPKRIIDVFLQKEIPFTMNNTWIYSRTFLGGNLIIDIWTNAGDHNNVHACVIDDYSDTIVSSFNRKISVRLKDTLPEYYDVGVSIVNAEASVVVTDTNGGYMQYNNFRN